MHKYHDLGDTVYFHFAANNPSGAGDDGTSPTFDVRLMGASASAAPVLSGTPTLLTHANYPNGAYEIAIAATTPNGFAADSHYAAFCSLTVGGVDPTGCVGSFSLAHVKAQVTGANLSALAAKVLATSLGYNNVREVGSGQTYSTIAAAVSASSAGDLVVVHDGTYDENSLGKNGVDLYLSRGAHIENSDTGSAIFDQGVTPSLLRMRVFGEGRLSVTADTSSLPVFYLDQASTNWDIECDSVLCNTDSNHTVLASADASGFFRLRATRITTDFSTGVVSSGGALNIHIEADVIQQATIASLTSANAEVFIDANIFTLIGDTPIAGSAGKISLSGNFIFTSGTANGINAVAGTTVCLVEGSVVVPAGRPSLSGSGAILVSEGFAYDTASATASGIVSSRGQADLVRTLLALPAVAPAANGGLGTVDANNRIAGIAGTITTLDALDTAQDAQHATTHGRLPTTLSANGYMKVNLVEIEDLDATTALETAVVNALNDFEWELDEDVLDAIAENLWNTLQVDADDVPDSMGSGLKDTILNAAKIGTAMQLDGAVWQFTQNALEEAPAPDSVIANFDTMTLLYGPNLTAVDYAGRTGITSLKSVLIDKNNKVFSTATNSFDTLLDSISWATSIRTMTEIPGVVMTGMAMYRASVPAQVPIGTYTVIVQDGADASADRLVTEMIFWDGQSVVPISGALNTAYTAIRTTNNLGSGSLSKTITMVSFGGAPIPNMPVWVTLDVNGQETIAGPMLTDDFGKATFMLNPGSYYAWGHGLNTNVVNPLVFSVP